MKRDLRSTKQSAFKPETMESSVENLDGDTMTEVQDAVNKYSGKSDDELLGELKAMKDAGVMNDNAISSFVTRIAPMLDADQQKRLNAIIGSLK